MRCISVRPIWAWLIAHGYKDVENRTWATTHRGAILIHASASLRSADYESALATIKRAGLNIRLPDQPDLPRGGIVGLSRISGCVDSSRSAWFVGPYGFELQSSCPIPFHPCKGRLGIFNVGLDSIPDVTRDIIFQELSHGDNPPL